MRSPVPEPLPALPQRLESLVASLVCNERDRGRPATLFGGGDDPRLGAAVYVGRNFAGREDIGFGNPLGARSQDNPAGVLVAYFDWVHGPSMRARVLRRRLCAGELSGRPLSCWCHPLPCHAWLLCGWANGAHDEVAEWIDLIRQHER